MLKNRDTPSNPYRVPPQPTPMWVKVSIPVLTLLLMGTIGVVVYLVIFRMECQCLVEKVDQNQEMADEGARKEDTMRALHQQFSNLNMEVARMKSSLDELEAACKRCRLSDRNNNVGFPSPTLSSSEQSLLRKVPQIESYAENLERQLLQHINAEQKICKRGHWRHGVHCYVVGDASLNQGSAKQWCRDDYGDQANLVIIKDKLTQDFVAGKLVNRLNSFWIGIERRSSVTSYTADSDLVPSSAQSGDRFVYADGTTVQRSVWHKWAARDSQQQGNCAAMTFDSATSQWRWEKKSCSDGLGYICQYYIMSR